MMLEVGLKKERSLIRSYVYHVIFTEFLQLEYQTVECVNEKAFVKISSPNSEKKIFVYDYFFQLNGSEWLQESSLPKITIDRSPVEYCDSYFNDFVSIFKKPDKTEIIEKVEDSIFINFDLFGAIFFFISRYEEHVIRKRDQFGRFTSEFSMFKEMDLIERPLVDEYTYLLKVLLEKFLLISAFSSFEYNIKLSHDVDFPSVWTNKKAYHLIKKMFVDIVKRRSFFKQPFRSFRSYWNWKLDPIFSTLFWLMDIAEEFGLKSAFYFIAGASHKLDFDYIHDKNIDAFISEVRNRGHEVGLHGSFESFTSSELLAQQKQLLEEKSGAKTQGGRQHYLRFDERVTWEIWDDLGMQYDSTLGFADRAGFRCGTAREYSVFSISKNKMLNLKERPLIVMEHSLLFKGYMGMNHQEFLNKIESLSKIVKFYGGNFSFLWHNHMLVEQKQKKLFSSSLTVAL